MKAQRPEQLELPLSPTWEELEAEQKAKEAEYFRKIKAAEARRSREGDSLEHGKLQGLYEPALKSRIWAESLARNTKREGFWAAPLRGGKEKPTKEAMRILALRDLERSALEDRIALEARRAQAQKALGEPTSVQRRREKLRMAFAALAAWLLAGALLAALMGSGGCASTNVHRDLYRGKISAPYTYIKGYIGENRWRAQACEGVDIESRLSLAGARMCKRVVNEAIVNYARKLKYGRATRKGLSASQTRDARRRELEGRMDDLQGQIDLRFGPVYRGF